MVVNRKQAQRVMRERELLVKSRHNRSGATDSGHGYPRYPNLIEDLPITRPNQVWVADITYVRLPGEYTYLAILMDVYTRNMLETATSRNCNSAIRKSVWPRSESRVRIVRQNG